MSISPQTQLNVTLSVQEIQLVVDALNELPRKVSDALINRLAEQANAQIAALKEAATPAPAPEAPAADETQQGE